MMTKNPPLLKILKRLSLYWQTARERAHDAALENDIPVVRHDTVARDFTASRWFIGFAALGFPSDRPVILPTGPGTRS